MAGESEWSVQGLEQVGAGTRPAKGQRVEAVPHGTRFVEQGTGGAGWCRCRTGLGEAVGLV